MRRHFAYDHHDAVIAWTPALSIGAPLRRAARSGIRHRLLIIFDFFPICHREAGIIRSRLVYGLQSGWRTASTVCSRLSSPIFRAMSTICGGTIRYAGRASALFADLGRIPACQPCEARDAVRRRRSLPLDRPIAIFGGQFSEGRGIDQMIDAARIASKPERGHCICSLATGACSR